MHNKPFQMTSRDINHGALADSIGYHVEVIRQPAGRRALFIFDETPEIRDLIDRFERREILPVPHKALLCSRTRLYYEAAKAVREAL